MDWSKAKNILIFLFLALNIFLAIYFFMNNNNDNSTNKNIANTKKILEQRGFIFKTEIPNTSKAYKLSYETGEFDRGLIIQKLLPGLQITLDKAIDNEELKIGNKTLTFKSKNSFAFSDSEPKVNMKLTDAGELEQVARNTLSQFKLPVENLYLDTYKTNRDKSFELIFFEKLNDYLIFDYMAKFVITEKGIVSLECKYVKVDSFSAEKTDIIPAYQILLQHFNEMKTGVIYRIDLGYQSSSKKATRGTNNPVWRVMLDDGTPPYYFPSNR